jgi:hypothetical protein
MITAPPDQAFTAKRRAGLVIHVPQGTSIGEKRNAGAQAVGAQYIASFDDDDFSLPSRLTTHLVARPLHCKRIVA